MNKVRSVWLGLMLLPALLPAQTKHPAAPNYPSNRYLLVVETSHAMLSRSEGMIREIQNLLGTALARQARRGDSLGIWTFNEQLYTGLLPLQEWAPENQQAVISRITQFLGAQKFEKRGRFDAVLPRLLQLVRRSPFLTVVLVCAGDDQVHGTPFDQRINDFFQNWRQQQLDARSPFVIALRAQGGALVDCSMNPAPWPVELPGLPKELFVALAPPPIGTNAAPKPAAAPVPPLIIIGKKHEPTVSSASETQAEARPQTASSAAPTNLALGPFPTAQPANPQPSSSPVPTPSAQGEKIAQAGTSVPQPAVPPMTVPAAAAPASAASVPKTPEFQDAANEPARSTTTVPSPGQTKSGGPAPTTTLSHASPGPVSIASAAPARSRPGVWIAGLGGAGLVAAALGTFLIWRRRSRAAADMSLITESIDRRKR